MKQWLIVIPLTLLLSSCEQEIDPKEAAIQREVARRVETVRAEMKVDEDRRHTIRVVVGSIVVGIVLISARNAYVGRRSTAVAYQPRPEVTRVQPSRRAGPRIIEPHKGPRRPFGD